METLGFTGPVNAKQCGSSLSGTRDCKSALASPWCVLGLKQAEQAGMLTGFSILLVDLSSEQQVNMCPADTATEGDLQVKWMVLEPQSKHPKA